MITHVDFNESLQRSMFSVEDGKLRPRLAAHARLVADMVEVLRQVANDVSCSHQDKAVEILLRYDGEMDY